MRLGNALVSGFGLRGLFGVDFVLRGEVPYPVEINPRYTASVEVLEHATGLRAMESHRQACETAVRGLEFTPLSPSGRGVGGEGLALQSLNASPPGPSPRKGEGERQVVAKAIVFATARVVMPSAGPWIQTLSQDVCQLPEFADIPRAGEVIEQGLPIITMFARGDAITDCLNQLRLRAHTLDHLLFGR
jgi:predicted ATP-grasp superfamily ATP-dependent carboligase